VRCAICSPTSERTIVTHQCLNEAISAMLTGEAVAVHMTSFRADMIDRFNRIRTSFDVDALFINPVGEDDEEDPTSWVSRARFGALSRIRLGERLVRRLR
jgi:hypothetical protein